MKIDGPPKASGVGRDFLVCIFLAVATLAVYGQVFNFGFSDYDDFFLISQNPMVRAGLTWPGFLWALQTSYFDFWHPVAWWSQMLDCQLFGVNAGWHHLVNVGFHLANTVLVYLLLRRMTGAWKRSAVVAALFALHPMHVESVAWLAERKDVLSAFFFLLATWSYVSYAKKTDAGDAKARRFCWRLVFFFFALGLMAKSMVVTFPFVLLLLDIWPLGRAAKMNSGLASGWLRPVFRELVAEKIPLFVLTLISCVITYGGMSGNQNVLSAEKVSWAARLAGLPVSYAEYLAKLFWPTNLAIFYPRPEHLGVGLILISLMLLIAISLLAIVFLRRFPFLMFGWLWFLGTLVPVIGIVSMSLTAISDRYTYIPSIGIFVAVVWLVAEVSAHWKFRNSLLLAASVVVLVLCGWLSWFQTGFWRDGTTLWSHSLAVTRDNAVAEYSLGWAYQHSDQPDKAMECYRATLRLQPDHLDANLNLGAALLDKGQARSAADYFNKALKLNPNYARAHEDLGRALFELGDYDGAIKHSTEAMRLDPHDFKSVFWLLKAMSAKTKSDEVLHDFADRLGASPLNPDIWYELGLEWLKRDMNDAAVASFDFAVQQNPASAEARFQLAFALKKKHAIAETIEQYRLLLKLYPDQPVALNNLAWILATQSDAKWRDGAEAVRLAGRACELTSSQETVFLGTLAAAYAENGQFEKAAAAAQNACNLALSHGQTNLFEANQQLLRQYEKREPCRERD